MENHRCPEHTGLEHEIVNLKDTVKEQWKVLNTMATGTLMKWIVGIFVIISMAVVGFLWHGQASMAAKIETKMESLDCSIQRLNIDVNRIQVIIREDKVDK